ncbi:MAG: hypothetical protein CM1200mP2_58540 [Planctomycetaceae bacterium]|nr:MAG: hypothetical protein CM1200mP2_58540 [Planctomycetaceae bacterium]
MLFGANVLLTRNVADQRWREFFQAFVKSLGTPTGFNIWNFQLPEHLAWHEPPQPGVCLTNNRIIWREEVPLFHQNIETRARTATPSLRTRSPRTSTQTQSLLGRTAHRPPSRHPRRKRIRPPLCRIQAAGKNPWVASWSNPQTVAITFDLKQPRALTQVKLWDRDILPAMTLEISNDGKAWKTPGQGWRPPWPPG